MQNTRQTSSSDLVLMRRGGRVFLLAALGLISAMMPAASRAQPAQRELIVALATFVEDNLDPTLVGGSTAPQLLPQIFDYLTMLDAKNRIIPGLARAWSVSADGKEWTFKLRPDLKFSNGDPLTAEDVIFTFGRHRDPKVFRSRYSGFMKKNVIGVKAPDPLTVVIELKEPAPDMLRIVGPTYGGVEIMPKKYFESVGADGFARKPVGSGPYKLVSHEPGVKIVYEARESHPFRRTAFSRLVLLNIPEESTRVAMLQRGEAHMTQVGADRVRDIRGDLEIREIPAAYQVGIAFWMPWADRSAPLANPTVRLALAHAVDGNAIRKGLYGGRGTSSLGWSVFPVAYFADPKRPSMQPFKYDPNLARGLLKKAGFDDGRLEVKLFSIGNDAIAPEMPKLATIVADYWTKVGVKVSIVGIGMTEFRAMYRGAAKAKNVGNTASVFRLPAILDVDFLCAKSQGYWVSDGTSPLVNNPEVDRLCSETMNAQDDKTRAAKIHQLYDELRKEVGGGFAIVDTPALWAFNKKAVGKWQPIVSYGIGLGVIYETVEPARGR